MMNRLFDITTSVLATAARLGYAERVGALGPRPQKPLELYEFEACPFCRKVREALTVLDLDAIIYPCPKGGPRFREEVKRRGGKAQFPYLVDPNTGKEMYESDDITRYLFATYGPGTVPFMLSAGPLTNATASTASIMRLWRGSFYRRSTPPALLLELYSYEGSPFCRIVREALCELELPYLLHNVAKGSPKREAFVQRAGKMQVPYLVDPNHNVAMFESADIVAYLQATYAESGR
ncbi:MAG: glutathione S-transferase N-terminal domain-containing protein [Thermodesulfobacteriota bacterium]